MWRLILEQFKDQLVIILLGSAAVSFVLALFEESDDWTAFVDPVVVCLGSTQRERMRMLTGILPIDPDYPDPQCCCRCIPGE